MGFQEVVKGALKNLEAASLKLLGAGAVVMKAFSPFRVLQFKAIAVFLDQAAREPRVESLKLEIY